MSSSFPPAASEPSAHPDGDAANANAGAAARAWVTEGGMGRPLGSRNVGILCADPQRPEALLVQQAANELGARTALVRPNLDDGGDPSSVEDTARVLGLLYDAVICVDLPPHSVERLRQFSRIPVLADLTFPGTIDPDRIPMDVSELRRLLLSRLAGTAA